MTSGRFPTALAGSSTAWTSCTRCGNWPDFPATLGRADLDHAGRMFGIYGKKGVIQPGADADLVIYDPAGHTSIGYEKTHHMNMDYSAWEGFEIDGHVDWVMSRGTVLVDDSGFVGGKGHGQYLKRGLSDYLLCGWSHLGCVGNRAPPSGARLAPAVLDERASRHPFVCARVRKAAADQRQPQRAERAKYTGASEHAFRSRVDDVGGWERDARGEDKRNGFRCRLADQPSGVAYGPAR